MYGSPGSKIWDFGVRGSHFGCRGQKKWGGVRTLLLAAEHSASEAVALVAAFRKFSTGGRYEARTISLLRQYEHWYEDAPIMHHTNTFLELQGTQLTDLDGAEEEGERGRLVAPYSASVPAITYKAHSSTIQSAGTRHNMLQHTEAPFSSAHHSA
eukprot:2216947-Rhodomonas_salina.2